MWFRIVCGLLLCLSTVITGRSQSAEEARQVIERFASGQKIPVEIDLSLEAVEGCDQYESSVRNGTLYIRASSGVAACRAFYEYLKSNGAGICSWSGNRLALPDSLPAAPKRTVVSPFKYHYYFNVVTFGYTTPYWDWQRWEKEIDWMALHGIDMPLALVANEAISARVWKKLGLTDKEIASYFVGPAHFPWMRMGNISGIDGPLPNEWHDKQVALQHKILKRMKSLGMKPICPGFAGFVPKAMSRLYPDVDLMETSWSGGAFHNWMVSPQDPLFSKIGQMFIEEWEKEFGENDYYLVDSFNEMEIPFPPKGTNERYALLADYGDKVYSSIKAGNPDAIWVMQGWMFGYQRDIWDFDTLKALLEKVPDDKMLLLDLAEDYNHLFWKNGDNWTYYKGFFGKDWVYSVIPNMGGKSGLTGNLEYLANGRLEAMHSSNKGKLSGYGMAPEGIENNEVLYELLTDGGWRTDSIDLNDWLKNYSICRYGAYSEQLSQFWEGLQNSVYGTFTDHPRYNWQFRPGTVFQGSINAKEPFFKAIEDLAEAIPMFKDSPLFCADMIEMTAHYMGARMELLLQQIEQSYQSGDQKKAKMLEETFEQWMLDTDRLLVSHPTLRLEKWLNYARGCGDTAGLKDYYEKNARRLVTVWGPPVDDYSARIWSGLLRDYYLPRWKQYFSAKHAGNPFDISEWELNWVEKTNGLSRVEPFPDVLEACRQLIASTKALGYYMNDKGAKYQLGVWSPEDLEDDKWQDLVWNIPVQKATVLNGVRFEYFRGDADLEISSVTLEMDGREVARKIKKETIGDSKQLVTYYLEVPSEALGNNSCLLRVRVRSMKEGTSYGSVVLVEKNV